MTPSNVVRGVPRPPSENGKFIYLAEFDLSLDNGPGINEREFVAAALRHHGEQMVCILPSPARPDVFQDPAIEYVTAPRGNAIRYLSFMASAFRRVAAIQRSHAIAAVVCRLGPTPILPFAIQRAYGLPLIFKTLALYSRFGTDERMKASQSRAARRAGRAGTLLKHMYRDVVRRAIHADTVSPTYASWLSEEFGLPADRVQIIPNGFNPELFRPGDRAAARREMGLGRFDHIVGYVGTLNEMRHVHVLIENFSKLDAERNVGLVLVGEGKGRAALVDVARSCGVADRVVFAGKQPYSKVPGYIQAFDVAVDLTLVSMTIAARTIHASFSQKISQYLGSGVPVIAWDTPDTRFLVEHDVGAVIPVDRPAELHAALDTFTRRAEERQGSQARQARAYAVRHLSIQHLTQRRFSAWRQACGAAARTLQSPDSTHSRAVTTRASTIR